MTLSNESTNNKQLEEYNIFRDSPLRYAGYCNEVGEAFRYQFPKLVRPSYVVSFGYVLADAVTTGNRTYQRLRYTSDYANHDTVHATVDVLLWQSLASVFIPGATIHVLVKATKFLLNQHVRLAPLAVWGPTVVGLGAIPFIVEPIDHGVDRAMDNSIRKIWPAVDIGRN
jgi:fission process protein 1